MEEFASHYSGCRKQEKDLDTGRRGKRKAEDLAAVINGFGLGVFFVEVMYILSDSNPEWFLVLPSYAKPADGSSVSFGSVFRVERER